MKKRVSAILTSDWHLRETTPVCRTDDFWESQWKKVDFVSELQKKYDCPVLHAGDLFDHWKPSPYLLSKTIEHLPKEFYTVYGNHDLPQNTIELKEKSGVFTLWKANALRILPQGHWGTNNFSGAWELNGKSIYVWHKFVYVGKEPFPGAKGKARAKLEKYKQFDLIVTGDNHQSFTFRSPNGNLLVNPGSLTRQDADQISFQPKVYLYYAETNEVEAVDVPIDKGVITREHIDKVQERDDRIDAFISRLKIERDEKMSVSFEAFMRKFFDNNRVRRDIKNIIYKAMEEEK
jgi:DNA repair exonuclease SbcCD nuclease subunit